MSFFAKKMYDGFIYIFKGLPNPLILNSFSWNTYCIIIFVNFQFFSIAVSTLLNGFAKFKQISNTTFINFIKFCNLCKICHFILQSCCIDYCIFTTSDYQNNHQWTLYVFICNIITVGTPKTGIPLLLPLKHS